MIYVAPQSWFLIYWIWKVPTFFQIIWISIKYVVNPRFTSSFSTSYRKNCSISIMYLNPFSVRCVLAMFVLNGLQKFRASICHKYGTKTARWHLIITCSQFHIMFYASRPLPNIFALAITMYAMAFWLRGQHGRFVMCSAFAILVFRGELALLLGICLLINLDRYGILSHLPTVIGK